MKLRGTVGVLTGASRGLGVYMAEALAKEGVNLALAARSADDLQVTAAKVEGLGVKAVVVPTDVTDPAALERLIATASSELGPIDLLVNNAGVERYRRYETAPLDEMEWIMRTNVLAPQILSRLVLPGMLERRKGHIVNIASVAGKTAVPFNSLYSSSKHALVGFSWSLREEVRSRGVSVSVLCPGYVTDAGMFADWSRGKKPPGVSSAVGPDKVVAGLIRAIEKDRAEVIVAGGLLKGVDVLHAISPALTTAIARKSGGYAFLEEQALSAWDQD
ncbi:MAG: SDR family NAD(P)-dependent oxidoreductase [Actinomycetota bacterium]